MRFNTSLVVNLSTLKENIQKLKKLAPKNKILFMVKADAYGHGIKEVVEFAYQQCDIKYFGVASLKEAIYCRKSLPYLKFEIYVFSDLNLDSKYFDYYTDFNIIPVIHSLELLETFLAHKEFDYFPLILKMDTGMHRIGIDSKEYSTVIKKLKAKGRSQIDHLMTHFASSYLPLKENDTTNKQYLEFCMLKEKFRENDIDIMDSSCANSGAIEQGVGLAESFIRPGLMLYGPQSTFSNEKLWNGKLMSSLRAEILKIEKVAKGWRFGYGQYAVEENGHLLFLAIGYGDGLTTNYQNSHIMLENEKAKFCGRVNMDISAIFVKNLPDNLKIGDLVNIWHDDPNNLIALAKEIKSIPYEMMTNISLRVPKQYI